MESPETLPAARLPNHFPPRSDRPPLEPSSVPSRFTRAVDRRHNLREVLLLQSLSALQFLTFALLRASLPLVLRRLFPLGLAVLEGDHPLVPEVADDPRRDLELLD